MTTEVIVQNKQPRPKFWPPGHEKNAEALTKDIVMNRGPKNLTAWKIAGMFCVMST